MSSSLNSRTSSKPMNTLVFGRSTLRISSQALNSKRRRLSRTRFTILLPTQRWKSICITVKRSRLSVTNAESQLSNASLNRMIVQTKWTNKSKRRRKKLNWWRKWMGSFLLNAITTIKCANRKANCSRKTNIRVKNVSKWSLIIISFTLVAKSAKLCSAEYVRARNKVFWNKGTSLRSTSLVN